MCAKISRVLCAFCLAFLLISCQSKESPSSVDKTKLTLMAEQVDGTSSYVMLVFEAGELSKWIDYQLVPYYQFQTEDVNETYFRRILRVLRRSCPYAGVPGAEDRCSL